MNFFQKTTTQDPLLQITYDIKEITEKFDYIKNSSFWKNNKPCILIFGGDNWLSHYLLHFFTEYNFQITVLFVGFANPEHLKKYERYQKIVFAKIDNIFSLEKYIDDYKPQIAFYTDNERNLSESSFLRLYHKNVSQVEKICQIIKDSSINRLILYSDACVYNRSSDGKETDVLKTNTALAKSFEDMEEIAEQYHTANTLEIYCLRLAAVYGPIITDGFMRIAYTMANGYLLGVPENTERIVSVVDGKNVVLSSLLIMLAPKPGYLIFNIKDTSISLKELLHFTSSKIPQKKIWGISTKFAEMLGIGYQDQIPVSELFLKYSGTFCEHTNDFFNQLRFRQKKYIFSENIATYILDMPRISSKRFKDMFGWYPSGNIEEVLGETLELHAENDWNLFHFADYYDDYTQNTLIPLYDKVADILQELAIFEKKTTKENQEFVIQISSFAEVQIDIKSLHIFFQEIWASLPGFFGKSNKKQSIPELITNIGQIILHILRYEHSVFERKYPNNTGQQIFHLTQRLGEFNSQKVKFYVCFAILSKGILELTNFIEKYYEFFEILPDKNIGILLHSEIGDIPIQIKIKNNQLRISFPQKEIDSFSANWSFEKKLAEFKKASNLYLSLGVYLKNFLYDFSSGDFPQRFTYHLGKYYMLLELEKKHLQQIFRMVGVPNKNISCLFITEGKIKSGIHIQHGRIGKSTSSFLSMVNKLLETIEEKEEVIKILEESSLKQEKFFLLNVKTIRKLLSAKFSSVLLKWLLNAKDESP